MDKIRNTIKKYQFPVIVAGTGNVARSVIYAIQQTDINLLGVITRGNDDSIEYLNKIKTPAFNFNQLVKEPCLCILAVPDCHIESAAKNLKFSIYEKSELDIIPRTCKDTISKHRYPHCLLYAAILNLCSISDFLQPIRYDSLEPLIYKGKALLQAG